MSRLINRILPLVLAAALATGCNIHEDLDDCPTTVERLRLRIIDFATGRDITDESVTQEAIAGATLYLFDEDSLYIGQLPVYAVDFDKDIDLDYAMTRADIHGAATYVSAWGNVRANITIRECGTGTNMKTEFLHLNHNGNEFHDCPGNIFFGTHDLSAPYDFTRATIPGVRYIDITQKNARLMVTVRGLPAGTTADDYYFRIENQNGGYDFMGVPGTSGLQIRENGSFVTGDGDYISTEPFYLIHSNDAAHITEETGTIIQIFRVGDPEAGTADTSLVTATQDIDGDLIGLSQGHTTNVLIDFGDGSVRVEITPWNEIYQWESWTPFK